MNFSASAAARRDEFRHNVTEACDHAKDEMLRRIVKHCQRYQGPDLRRSLSQFGLNFAIYAVLFAAMITAAKFGYWPVSLLLAPFAGGMLVKLFIIQHDCGHGSYFENPKFNHALGFFLSLFTFTPYAFWRDAHNRHHASSGNLDKRGIGAVDTLTVDEYRALPLSKRIMYRVYRHPAVLILFGSPLYFLVLNRLPIGGAMPFAETYTGLKFRQIWKSIFMLNGGLVLFYGSLALWLGAGPVALTVIPAISVASWVGTWLFFVQHQYEDVYWAENGEWNFAEAAVFGSSHYKLPQPLRWMTGNIGLHHIHHLSSRIPNYRLMECYKESSDLLSLKVLTIRESIKCARLALWDAAQRKMVTFAAARGSV